MIKGSLSLAFLYLTVASNLQYHLIWAIATLHIGGLFPFSGLGGNGVSMKGDLIEKAVRMAIEDIQIKGILPGYLLQLHINDTQVRPKKSTLNTLEFRFLEDPRFLDSSDNYN